MLRRLLQLHPQVKRIYHENFLLKKCLSKDMLFKYVSQRGIKPTKDNWGEKVPYYPSARKYPIIKYCHQWNSYFGDQSRIIHIVRHPYDIALSNVKKFKNINKLAQPLTTYKSITPTAITKIEEMKTSLTFKYEDLLIDPDRILAEIYSHCGLTPDIDYKSRMKKIQNVKYQTIDPSRAFAYKQTNYKFEVDLKKEIEVLNKIKGVKYTT